MEGITGLPFELIVLQLPENRGNAGGVEDAMEHAFAKGADAVWILDDDSWPRDGALAALLDIAVGTRCRPPFVANRPQERAFHLALAGHGR